MWPFKKKKQTLLIDKNLLDMARIYVDCTSIEEFLVHLDLKMNKECSKWKWTNPFVIFDAMKNKTIKKIFQFAFPVGVFGIGTISWMMPSEYIFVRMLVVLIQFSIGAIQFWIINKEIDARRAISQIEFERFNKEALMQH